METSELITTSDSESIGPPGAEKYGRRPYVPRPKPEVKVTPAPTLEPWERKPEISQHLHWEPL